MAATDEEWFLPSGKKVGRPKIKLQVQLLVVPNQEEMEHCNDVMLRANALLHDNKLSLWHIAPFNALTMSYDTYAEHCLRQADVTDATLIEKFLAEPTAGAGVGVFLADKKPDYAMYSSINVMQVNMLFCNTPHGKNTKGPALVDIIQSDMLSYHWSKMIKTLLDILRECGDSMVHGARMTVHTDPRTSKRRNTTNEFYKVQMEIWYVHEDNLIGAPQSTMDIFAMLQTKLNGYKRSITLAPKNVVGHPNVFFRDIPMDSRGRWLVDE